MDSVIISGICRCCSSEGPSKDLTSAYHWMGEEEIYEQMLRDCFSIALSAPDDDRSFGGICEVCITQLRNAYNFKKQVVLTEDLFKKRLTGALKTVKVEVSRADADTDSDGDFGENDNDTDYDVPIKMEEEFLEDELEVEKPKKRAAKAQPSTSKAKKPMQEAESSKKGKQKDEQLICPECNQSFTTLFNLKRHRLNKHGVDAKLSRKLVCHFCGKLVFNREFLAKHLVVGCPRKKKECVICDLPFDTKSGLLKHMKQEHWSSHVQKMNCPLCNEGFKSHMEHDSHLSQDHDVNLEFEELMFDCLEDLMAWKEEIEQKLDICLLKRTSSDKEQYYLCYPKKYLGLSRIPGRSKTCPARIEIREDAQYFFVTYQSVHVCDASTPKRNPRSQNILCPICEVQLHSYEELNSHVSAVHDVCIDEKEFTFDGFHEFMSWKQDIEKKNSVRFSKRTSYTYDKKNGEKIRKSYFFCAMSGSNKGRKKSQKIGKTCPARMLLSKRDDSLICHVSYQATHVDHADTLRLTQDEKQAIARMIESGETIQDVLKTCHESNDPNSKLKNLSRIDLYNIIRDLKIDKDKVNYRKKFKRKKKLPNESEHTNATNEETDIDEEEQKPVDDYDANDYLEEDVVMEFPETECEDYASTLYFQS